MEACPFTETTHHSVSKLGISETSMTYTQAWGRAKTSALQRKSCTGICEQRPGQVSRKIVTASKKPKQGSSIKQTCSSGDKESF